MTSSNVIFHNFKGHQVRHVMIEGEPWFVAADVCRCLGLNIDKGTYSILRPLRDDERRITPKPIRGKGGQSPTVISESGLYRLVMRSDKLEAREFQDWVTREVLPAIRKTGGYLLNEEARETAAVDQREAMPLPQDFPSALRALADEHERRAAAEKVNAELAAAREAERPKVEAFDTLMESGGSLSLRDAAKALGWGPIEFTSVLRSKKLLYYSKQRSNRAYQTHIDAGYYKVSAVRQANGFATVQVRVTPKGLEWLRQQLGTGRAKAA